MSRLRDLVKVVVLDWDETITERDTMSILAKASTATEDQWQGFVDAYMSDMQHFESCFGPRETLEAQYRFLTGLQESEMRSVGRIEQSGVFRGVTHDAIAEAAKEVKIRDGFIDFCSRLEADVGKEILSVNWSREFIRYALSNVVDSSTWTITANVIQFDDHGCGTGAVSKDKEGGIRTAIDKEHILQQRLEQCHADDGLLVYIGDSNTDLAALLKADLGIIFGNNASLQKTCERYGVAIKPFAKLDRSMEYRKEPLQLFHVQAWDEVVF